MCVVVRRSVAALHSRSVSSVEQKPVSLFLFKQREFSTQASLRIDIDHKEVCTKKGNKNDGRLARRKEDIVPRLLPSFLPAEVGSGCVYVLPCSFSQHTILPLSTHTAPPSREKNSSKMPFFVWNNPTGSCCICDAENFIIAIGRLPCVCAREILLSLPMSVSSWRNIELATIQTPTFKSVLDSVRFPEPFSSLMAHDEYHGGRGNMIGFAKICSFDATVIGLAASSFSQVRFVSFVSCSYYPKRKCFATVNGIDWVNLNWSVGGRVRVRNTSRHSGLSAEKRDTHRQWIFRKIRHHGQLAVPVVRVRTNRTDFNTPQVDSGRNQGSRAPLNPENIVHSTSFTRTNCSPT